MSPESISPVLSNRLLQQFVAVLTDEIGPESLPLVLAKVNLSPSVIEKEALDRLDGTSAAEVYAWLQQAMRLFYGRGARGTLVRIGRGMWEKMTEQATLRERAELQIIRVLPVPARRRRVLEFVAERLHEGGGAVSVQLLDIDLLLADRSGAAAWGQSDDKPICFVTLGLIQGALSWATRQEADVEEITCKATGASACEFKVKLGGK